MGTDMRALSDAGTRDYLDMTLSMTLLGEEFHGVQKGIQKVT